MIGDRKSITKLKFCIGVECASTDDSEEGNEDENEEENKEENGFVDTEEDENEEENEEENGFVDTEERVREAMDRATGSNLCEESRDNLESDLTEKRLVDDFTTIGCGCEKGPNKSFCSLQFDRDYISSVRDSCLELSHSELDMLLMGQILACTDGSYSSFLHHGKRIFKKTFFFFHAISQKRVHNIKKSLKHNGLVARTHGNAKRTLHNAISFEKIQNVSSSIHMLSKLH